MKKIGIREISVIFIITIITIVFNVLSGYYFKTNNSSLIYNKFYSQKAQGIKLNIKDLDKKYIEFFNTIEEDVTLHKSLENDDDNIETRAIFYKGDIQEPPIKEGRFFSEEDIKSKEKSAVIGVNCLERVIEKNGEKYIDFNGRGFKVIGIMGGNNKSDIDDIIFLNLPTIIDRASWDGMYVLDSDNDKAIEKSIVNINEYIDDKDNSCEEIDLVKGEVSLGLSFIIVYGFTIIALISSMVLIMYYYVEKEKKKVAIKKLCGARNKFLIKELVIRQFIFIVIGFAIGTLIFVISRNLFGLNYIYIINLLVVYLLINIVSIGALIMPINKMLKIDTSILLK